MVDRVLLTGAGGFVGSHVLRHLMMNTDYEVVCPVTFKYHGKSQRIASALEGNHEWQNRVSVVMHDLTAPIDELTADKFGDINYILNVASESHVDRSIEYPVPFVQNNVSLMLNVLEYARTLNNLKMFLQMSTDEVYGPAAPGFNSLEWAPIKPSNPYAASKAAQEAIAMSYWRTYGVPLIITNTMNIFGEMQDREKYFAKIMDAVACGKTLSIHASSDGVIGSRFYLHARNLADAWLFLIQKNLVLHYPTYPEPARVNIVGSHEVNNLDLAMLIAQYMGKKLKYRLVDFHSSRPGHDLRYALDGSLLANMGWRAPHSFEQSVRHTVEWTLQHPEWL